MAEIALPVLRHIPVGGKLPDFIAMTGPAEVKAGAKSLLPTSRRYREAPEETVAGVGEMNVVTGDAGEFFESLQWRFQGKHFQFFNMFHFLDNPDIDGVEGVGLRLVAFLTEENGAVAFGLQRDRQAVPARHFIRGTHLFVTFHALENVVRIGAGLAGEKDRRRPVEIEILGCAGGGEAAGPHQRKKGEAASDKAGAAVQHGNQTLGHGYFPFCFLARPRSPHFGHKPDRCGLLP
jgi:hypothetical protein